MRRATMLVLIGLLATLVLACSGDDDDDDDGADPTPTATTADAGGDDGGDDGDAANGDGDVSAEFSELLRLFNEQEARVTYEVTSTAAGQEFSGEMTWYRALDGRARFDFAVEQAGQDFEVITIFTEEASYFCSGLLGANACFEASDDSALPVPDLSDPIVSQVDDFGRYQNFGDVTTETIAGVEGRCVTFDEDGAEGQLCVSDDGLLLRADVDTQGATTRLELLDFEFSVSDSDFEPPYPVSSFPGTARPERYVRAG